MNMYLLIDNFKNNPVINKDNRLNWCSMCGFSSFSYGILGIIIYIFTNNFVTEKYGIPIPINLYVLCLITQSLTFWQMYIIYTKILYFII